MAGNEPAVDSSASGLGCEGTKENANGLLRQSFPKGSDLRAYTLDELRAVEQRLNRRPRKRLAWRSPARVMEAE